MDWPKVAANLLSKFADVLGKLRPLFAWLFGYFYGRKFERLKNQNEVLKKRQEESYERNKVSKKWDEIRKRNNSNIVTSDKGVLFQSKKNQDET